jgi:hypothetical protein
MALALAACGGSSNSTSSTQAAQTGAGQTSASSTSTSQATGSGATSATTTGVSSTATTSGTGGAALAGTARESSCPTSALQLSFVSGQGAAGTAYMTYALTNVGPRTCTLFGYPGVSITDSAGHTVQHPAQRGISQAPAHAATVTLAHGSAAHFLVTSSDVIPSPGCPHAFTGTTLRVYPPNQRQALTTPHSAQFCNLRVGPVQAAH